MLTPSRQTLAFCLGALVTLTMLGALVWPNATEPHGKALARTVAIAVEGRLVAKDILGLQALSRDMVYGEWIAAISIYDVEGQLLAGHSQLSDDHVRKTRRYTAEVTLMDATAGIVEITLLQPRHSAYTKQLWGALFIASLLPLLLYLLPKFSKQAWAYSRERSQLRRDRIADYQADKQARGGAHQKSEGAVISLEAAVDKAVDQTYDRQDEFFPLSDESGTSPAYVRLALFWDSKKLEFQLSASLFKLLCERLEESLHKVSTLYSANLFVPHAEQTDSATAPFAYLEFREHESAGAELFSAICAGSLINEACREINDVPLALHLLIYRHIEQKNEPTLTQLDELSDMAPAKDSYIEQMYIQAEAFIEGNVGDKVVVDTHLLHSGWVALKEIKAPYSALLKRQGEALSGG